MRSVSLRTVGARVFRAHRASAHRFSALTLLGAQASRAHRSTAHSLTALTFARRIDFSHSLDSAHRSPTLISLGTQVSKAHLRKGAQVPRAHFCSANGRPPPTQANKNFTRTSQRTRGPSQFCYLSIDNSVLRVKELAYKIQRYLRLKLI